MRQVVELQSVEVLDGWPPWIPKRKKAKGSKAAGNAYEKKVGRLLRRTWPDLVSGRWFGFTDLNGIGCCQPDHFLVLPDQVLLLECKLSQTEVAWVQMEGLYKPILEAVYEKPVTCVQVCKYLYTMDQRLISKLETAIAGPGGEFLWHCLL